MRLLDSLFFYSTTCVRWKRNDPAQCRAAQRKRKKIMRKEGAMSKTSLAKSRLKVRKKHGRNERATAISLLAVLVAMEGVPQPRGEPAPVQYRKLILELKIWNSEDRYSVELLGSFRRWERALQTRTSTFETRVQAPHASCDVCLLSRPAAPDLMPRRSIPARGQSRCVDRL